MTSPDQRRYALYFSPPADDPLCRIAARWLGRDAFKPVQRPEPDARHSNPLTAEPSRYGFHATLKAPFHLAKGTTRDELKAAIRRFADVERPCPIGPMRVGVLGGFFALLPKAHAPALRGFASRIVAEFDRFRAPMNGEDLRRRLRTPLDETETTNLVTWGYPYVHDRYRFHMTLTGQIEPDERGALARQLEHEFSGFLDADYFIDAVTLFEQEQPEADFVATARFEFRHCRRQFDA